MNFQIEIRKIEKFRSEALNKIKDLRYDVSKYDEAIANLNRLHKTDIENSLKLTKILKNYSKEKVYRIVNLLFKSLQNSEKYRNFYKDLDVQKILDDVDCLNFIIVECGEGLIDKIMLRFNDVVYNEEFNEPVLELSEHTQKGVGNSYMDGKDYNFAQTMFNKFTKKSVYDEIVRRDKLIKQGHPINLYSKLVVPISSEGVIK